MANKYFFRVRIREHNGREKEIFTHASNVAKAKQNIENTKKKDAKTFEDGTPIPSPTVISVTWDCETGDEYIPEIV